MDCFMSENELYFLFGLSTLPLAFSGTTLTRFTSDSILKEQSDAGRYVALQVVVRLGP